MKIIKHRVNRISDFEFDYGIEIDVRDYNGELVLSHDYPNKNDFLLKNYLNDIPLDTMIAINVKSCGIEENLKNIITDLNIRNYFVFDFSFPYLLKAQEFGITTAFRLSEYEKDEQDFCKWVWIDCFNSIWYDSKFLKSLKDKKFKIAIVSPDIHNRQNEDEFLKIKKLDNENLIDVICTKYPEVWND